MNQDGLEATGIEMPPNLDSLLLPSGLLNEELLSAIRSPAAPIRMPSDEQLAVRLIPENNLIQLFQVDSDARQFGAILSAAIGAIIGFVTNAVTATDFRWTPANAALFGFFSCALLISLVQTIRMRRRSTAQKHRLMAGSPE